MPTPDSLFIDTIDIYRSVSTVDSGGSPVETPAFIGALRCNVQPFKSDESVKGGREFSKPMYNIFVNNAADVQMKDEVLYLNDKYDIVELDTYPRTYKKLVISKSG